MIRIEHYKFKLFFPPIFNIIFKLILIPSLSYILLYEFYFFKIPSKYEIYYKLGNILLKLCYSTLASSIFYLVTQYIGIFLPKFQKKIKIFPLIKSKTTKIDICIQSLFNTIGLSMINIKDFESLDNHLKKINTDSSVGIYENWYIYLENIKNEILENIKTLIIYHEYLNDDIFIELNLLDAQFKEPFIFDGYKIYATSNLSYASIVIQEIILHNQILQDLVNKEFQVMNKYIDENIKDYRDKHFKL